MFCSNCGFNLPDDARFCPSCGAQVAGVASSPQPQQQLQPQQAPQQQAQYQQAQPQQAPQQQAQAAPQQAQPQYQQLQQSGPQQTSDQRTYYNESSQAPQPYVQHTGVPEPPYPSGRQPNPAPGAPQGKKTNRPLVIVIIVLAVIVIALLAALALGVFSPRQTDGSTAASSVSSQASSQSASVSSQASSAGSDAKGGTAGSSSAGASSKGSSASSASSASAKGSSASSASSASSKGSSASSASASGDAKKAAVEAALDKGYQIFEGTLRVLSTRELANLQGVDPGMFSAEGTHVVLVFDAPFQVSGMSGDGSGSRRESASMLGVAEYTDYGSFVVDKGDVDYWRGLDGEHMTLGAMADKIWFPSDVSLPVGEPSTQDAVVVFAD